MESDHTQGTWKVKEQGDADEYCLITDDNKWIFAFRQNGQMSLSEQRANIKLIEAAPKLLAMLIDATNRIESLLDTDCECDNTHENNGTECCLCQYRKTVALVKAHQ